MPSSNAFVEFLSSALINDKNNCEYGTIMFFVSPKCTIPTAGALNTVFLLASHILAYLVPYSGMVQLSDDGPREAGVYQTCKP